MNIKDILIKLGIDDLNLGTSTGTSWLNAGGKKIKSFSPVDGMLIAEIQSTDSANYEAVVEKAQEAFLFWRNVPGPKRGDIVRQFGNALRENKDNLGALVSYEMGKSLQEGLGEVQEMIDICDFAVGISRQMYGLTMHSERPNHRMYEQWHPLGIVGTISAFNFPVAVWAWNTALAWVCGNVSIWKPSSKTPLCAVACQKIVAAVLANNGMPEGISNLLIGNAVGDMINNDKRIPLVSFTGSTKIGRIVSTAVASRFGRSILELGGNNALIISKDADLEMSIIGAVFGAVGTAGQRCTSTRRLIIHEDIYEVFKAKLVKAYAQLRIGNPLDQHNHVGPLIDKQAVQDYHDAILKGKEEGALFVVEGGVLEGVEFVSGCYVKPCIAEVKNDYQIVQEETFAPILYLIKYKTLKEAIELQNNVPQGLSSSIMTLNMREAEQFLSVNGSDCGIANVNIGTSGAEIGGAFGGEKETGGGRESGSDAWKGYMRRQTNTINYSDTLPLAQGIKFDF
ncbi:MULTISPECIES: aldehyde dehydrogenase family protein [unclassified Sphingobacterium]|uniref:L-piperidine-6-carboxylate dehydrogenase n=1 Tax=unclassified Sphingobacterium TaxID=2609468 RepID=UPI00104D17F7|nr:MULTISPECIES: aldehyde dehydrogenase family protein [unclassified Sphingobacterium]MCS3556169.1 aldehyde dehydrogenase (NAD+) [Sphingobacterium sp. JUb21]TCR08545.1 aldehyde dehydrogenase (NAD+) [Sphingobacterium sp. JUb20]